MSLSISCTPLDIQIQILEDVIDVPEFFDADPVNAYGLVRSSMIIAEAYYWRSERWRNALRSVCRSWNQILSSPLYTHRFVLIADIRRGHIKASDIPWHMVIRISLRYSSDRYAESGGSFPYWEIIGTALRDYRSAGKPSPRWRLRIIDYVHSRIAGIFGELIQVAPLDHIRITSTGDFAMSDDDRAYSDDLYIGNNDGSFLESLTSQTRLRFLQWEPTRAHFSGPKLLSPSFPNLTTLHLVISAWVIDTPFEAWYMPCLYHLCIDHRRPRPTSDGWLPLLRRILAGIGGSLRTFYANWVTLNEPIPDDIWSLVPKLTDICILCRWTNPPPPTHPLINIHLPYSLTAGLGYHINQPLPGLYVPGDSTGLADGKDKDQLALMQNGWDRRPRHIITVVLWEEMILWKKFDYLHRISERYMEIGWIVTDYSGLTFQEFLVVTLKRRKQTPIENPWDWYASHLRESVQYGEEVDRPLTIGEEERDFLNLYHEPF